MAERRYSRAEVEAVVANPARGQFAPPARDIIEHFGYTANGRYPINVKVDLEANAAYVRYQPISGGQRFARNERLSQDVIIDFDADSHVCSASNCSRSMKKRSGLRGASRKHAISVFPRDLAAALVAA